MNGTEAYEKKYTNKINNIIEQNSDKSYLAGFYYFVSGNMSYSSIYDYLNTILKFMEYIDKIPEDLTLDDYTKFLSTLKQKTSSYQIMVYSALKKFSLYLKASEQNIKHPMQHVARPKAVESKETKEKREKGFLNEEEIEVYLESIDCGVGTKQATLVQEKWKERDKLIAYLFLTTGMRCSALYKLDVDNIDFKNRKISIIEKRDKLVDCPIVEDMVLPILLWLEKRKEILQGKEESALFISNKRTRMDQVSIYRVVQKYAQYIPDKNITPHKLRATYGSLIYKETSDLYLTQKCMGHSNPKTTELYIRGQEDLAREKGANAISKAIKF